VALIGTIEEQEELGSRRSSRENFILPYGRNELTPAEREVLGQALATSGHVMAHRQMAHLARSEETPITNALSSLIYSFAYSVAGAMITGGLLILLLSLFGGDEEIYLVIWFILWGLCFVGALAYNRWQGLWFSPAGLDHHEIDSRERIAKFVVDRHIELLEKKWQLR
jgi:hypothetical protein